MLKRHVVLYEASSQPEKIMELLKRFDLLSNPVTITVVPPTAKKPDK